MPSGGGVQAGPQHTHPGMRNGRGNLQQHQPAPHAALQR